MALVRLLPLLLASSIGAHAAQPLYELKLEPRAPLSRFDTNQIALLEKLNRADARYLEKLPALAVPDRWDLDELSYSPLPSETAWCAPGQKLLVVDLGVQAFGAYQDGRLTRWGPISSGRRQHPTPSGLFNLNWRSEGRHSTQDPSWYMRWYFNFHNTRGLALHEYSLPGKPASHACVRLLTRDAEWLYSWGDGWSLDPSGESITKPGTPLVILGSYDFDAIQPWLDPARVTERVILPEVTDPLLTSGGGSAE